MKQPEKADGLYVASSLCISAGVWIEAGPGNALITFGVAMLFGALWKSLFAYIEGGDQ